LYPLKDTGYASPPIEQSKLHTKHVSDQRKPLRLVEIGRLVD
jgi:hypothetical protein